MTDQEFDEAALYWQKKDANNVRMPENKLRQEIEAFLTENNTLTLATGGGADIRCTPLEYAFHDGAIWIFTEGGRKFRGLKGNRNVSAAVYKYYEGFGNLAGLQITGTVEMVEPFSEEYVRNAEFKKIPIAALQKLESLMHLIKIIPMHYEFLKSSFKKDGYSSRQEMDA